jgi:hypothetical protein
MTLEELKKRPGWDALPPNVQEELIQHVQAQERTLSGAQADIAGKVAGTVLEMLAPGVTSEPTWGGRAKRVGEAAVVDAAGMALGAAAPLAAAKWLPALEGEGAMRRLARMGLRVAPQALGTAVTQKVVGQTDDLATGTLTNALWSLGFQELPQHFLKNQMEKSVVRKDIGNIAGQIAESHKAPLERAYAGRGAASPSDEAASRTTSDALGEFFGRPSKGSGPLASGSGERLMGEALEAVKDKVEQSVGQGMTFDVQALGNKAPVTFREADKQITQLNQNGWRYLKSRDPVDSEKGRLMRETSRAARIELSALLDNAQAGLGEQYNKARQEFFHFENLRDVLKSGKLYDPRTRQLDPTRLRDYLNGRPRVLDRILSTEQGEQFVETLNRGLPLPLGQDQPGQLPIGMWMHAASIPTMVLRSGGKLPSRFGVRDALSRAIPSGATLPEPVARALMNVLTVPGYDVMSSLLSTPGQENQ